MDNDRASPGLMLAIGIGMTAGGLYLILVALGIAPPPRPANGPPWLVLCIGLAVVIAGMGALIQLVGRARSDGSLPSSAPAWLRAFQKVLMLAILVCFGAIGSWIAFGPGVRSFSSNVPFITVGRIGEIFGRTMFGIGAILIWLCVIAMVVSGARHLLGRNKSSPSVADLKSLPFLSRARKGTSKSKATLES